MAADLAGASDVAFSAPPDTSLRIYQDAAKFLERHTKVVTLSNSDGARVAICPEWQGRVMTSTCGGESGLSLGFVHREFIEEGKPNPHFSNFGGEERLWLSPEGGPYSLWFKPGAAQTLDNWFTPPALNEGAFGIDGVVTPGCCRMSRPMRVRNTAGTEFVLRATREVRLLDKTDLEKLLGPAAVGLISRAQGKLVAYETVNTITNEGPAMTKAGGLVSMWILSMLNAGPRTVILVPYRGGPEETLGPVVRADYFGVVPPERLKVTPAGIFMTADANHRSKIGVSQRRARDILGSIDFQDNVLTIARFSMPEDPTKVDYMNNAWDDVAERPYVGDVVNAYNDGAPSPGKKGLGAFYEIESLSPAAALEKGQSLVHRHATIHIQAGPAALADLAEQTLGVELDKVRQTMGIR